MNIRNALQLHVTKQVFFFDLTLFSEGGGLYKITDCGKSLSLQEG
jgi:hypothetical protein